MELLEEYFDTAFDAPDGIKKLRKLILTLAMQGKLVPQDPADQPASELLKEIEAEKQRLIEEKKIKKQKALPAIKDEEVPFDIPARWEWVRLNSIVSLLGDGIHGTPKYDEAGEFYFINGNNLSDGLIEIKDNTKRVSLAEFEKHKKDLTDRTVLVSINGTIGNVAFYNNEKVMLGKSACYFNLFPGISKQYVKKIVNSDYFLKYAFQSATGSTIKNVSLKAMRAFCLPIPPLAEQRRIVAKVDQLMFRCNELEKLRLSKEAKRISVHTSAVRELLAAKEESSFADAWQFLTEHFGDLYSAKENVAELRKAILQLAIMGKLVPQDVGDQPASGLLAEIEEEKQRLIKKKRIKKQKALPAIKDEEIPFDIPAGWEWVRLGQAGALERGKSKHRPRNDPKLFANGIYPLVQTGDVSSAKRANGIIYSFKKEYNEFGLKQSRLWPKGTLCITIAANIAETGFLGMEACFPDSVVAFLALDASLSKFVKMFIDVAKDDLENFAPSTAQKNINLGILNTLAFPLAPLEEQKRIVTKVDQLMALCDNLEQQIDNSTAKQTDLLNAVMARV